MYGSLGVIHDQIVRHWRIEVRGEAAWLPANMQGLSHLKGYTHVRHKV